MARAGQLSDRVTFEAEQLTPDGGGGSALAWISVATVWGQFIPERGRERLEAGRLESAIAGVLRVRSSALMRTITAAHRVQIKSVPYQIRSFSNPDRRNRMIEMLVESGGDSGVAT
jgi:SPP1 family predicted phage head-tail adaptor